MITYIYWIFIVALTIGSLFLLGIQLKQWVAGLVVSGVILCSGLLFYYFYLEQVFVKRWGGTMSIKVPAGQRHIAATWKADNLWIENYDPVKNVCIFQEYSRGNMLEGKVMIKDCNPLLSDK
ncbi:MAG: hypothetical protein CSA49_02230 [Gammaproteobacteria bacterium]|nr:MAG: hypothetical protein CSA49_02230 [Gammaproteobacteria bacterium]